MSFRVKAASEIKKALMMPSTGRFMRGVGRTMSGQGRMGMWAPLLGSMALQSIDNPMAQMGGQLLMMNTMMGGRGGPQRSPKQDRLRRMKTEAFNKRPSPAGALPAPTAAPTAAPAALPSTPSSATQPGVTLPAAKGRPMNPSKTGPQYKPLAQLKHLTAVNKLNYPKQIPDPGYETNPVSALM